MNYEYSIELLLLIINRFSILETKNNFKESHLLIRISNTNIFIMTSDVFD